MNPPPSPNPRRLRRWLWSPVVALVTLFYLLEEWLWERLQVLMRVLGALPGVRRLEAWIGSLPPAGAAVFFVLPSALILPVKLVAVHAILHGHLIRGTLVIIGAKLAATALFARIYVLTRPALMRVRWFVLIRRVVLRWRAWTYAQIESHPLWRAMRRMLARWRAGREARPGRWARRWQALERFDRMRAARRGTCADAGPRER